MSTEEQLSEIKGIDSLKQFYEDNKKNINIAAIAVILLMGGLWYYVKQYKPALEIEAADNIFTAERYFKQDSLDKALNGDGINMGMIDVADEFGSTLVGERAAFYSGLILLRQGKYQEALDYLDDASFDDEFLAAQVLVLKGDCYSELGEYSEAGDYYMNAADKRDNELTTPRALKKAAEAYEEGGEFDDALDAYNSILKEYNKSSVAINIEADIARVKAKQSAK